MKIFVISLDNEIGKNRREKLNYEHEIFWGNDKLENVPHYILNKIFIPHFSKPENRDKILKQRGCCLSSHLQLLQKIIDENLHNVIVCEDDAIIKDINLLKNLEDLNLDEPVLLNGKLHHPKTYEKDNEFNDKDIKFENGINEIDYNSYRWSCTACVYYPTPKSAEYIIEFFKNVNKISNVDLTLAKKKVIKKLYYPSLFIIKDDGISQIDKSKGLIDNFICF